MKPITNSTDLRRAILELEDMQTQEWALMKMELESIGESLKPGNLIKSAVRDFVSDKEAGKKGEDTALGIAAGYLAKKTVNGMVSTSLGKTVQLAIEVLTRKKGKNEETSSLFSGKRIIEFLLSLRRNNRNE